jgi:hypothetical protein
MAQPTKYLDDGERAVVMKALTLYAETCDPVPRGVA